MTCFDTDPVTLARALIGAHLVVREAEGIIVETEAYALDDPASHSSSGPSRRNAAMFGPPGTAYIYRSYGIHWCMNVVCQTGSGVLLRAVEPTAGLDLMAARRGVTDPRALCSGPGKLGQALGIGPDDGGRPFATPDFAITFPATPPPLLTGPRIGITRAADRPWRFGLAGSRYLSRPFRKTDA
ncbi:MAG: DNA-3-methyladenine glycosylase [Pseudorhodobacter sp.]|nr:DNA-3-methyladenine glycosylase [Pseudorhodobacter sp.]